jgi:hypothetical protein
MDLQEKRRSVRCMHVDHRRSGWLDNLLNMLNKNII